MTWDPPVPAATGRDPAFAANAIVEVGASGAAVPDGPESAGLVAG